MMLFPWAKEKYIFHPGVIATPSEARRKQSSNQVCKITNLHVIPNRSSGLLRHARRKSRVSRNDAGVDGIFFVIHNRLLVWHSFNIKGQIKYRIMVESMMNPWDLE